MFRIVSLIDGDLQSDPVIYSESKTLRRAVDLAWCGIRKGLFSETEVAVLVKKGAVVFSSKAKYLFLDRLEKSCSARLDIAREEEYRSLQETSSGVWDSFENEAIAYGMSYGQLVNRLPGMPWGVSVYSICHDCFSLGSVRKV